MSRAIEPRKLKRLANILEYEADTYRHSYAVMTETAGEYHWPATDALQGPGRSTRTPKQLHDEYRRLAQELREVAG